MIIPKVPQEPLGIWRAMSSTKNLWLLQTSHAMSQHFGGIIIVIIFLSIFMDDLLKLRGI